MKLQNELTEAIRRFSELSKKHDLQAYANKVKESKEYNDLKTRVAWDILHACYKSGELCEWYDKYDCHDTHITTLALKAFDTLNINL